MRSERNGEKFGHLGTSGRGRLCHAIVTLSLSRGHSRGECTAGGTPPVIVPRDSDTCHYCESQSRHTYRPPKWLKLEILAWVDSRFESTTFTYQKIGGKGEGITNEGWNLFYEKMGVTILPTLKEISSSKSGITKHPKFTFERSIDSLSQRDAFIKLHLIYGPDYIPVEVFAESLITCRYKLNLSVQNISPMQG
ncbi:hypothetical protein L6452_42800 [Arctium lappa]|uniref:Uncharacterized protein n=1 Tax=Arctium lappa TaxID=4217 RepID=A0ACB8XKE1_ARCLA|nr:hypothetical protein L6452_42800 [Arctium lappa]